MWRSAVLPLCIAYALKKPLGPGALASQSCRGPFIDHKRVENDKYVPPACMACVRVGEGSKRYKTMFDACYHQKESNINDYQESNDLSSILGGSWSLG